MLLIPASTVEPEVELDGGYHEETEEYDASRTRFLEGEGYRVVRFTNDDVIEDPDAVLLCLAKLLGVDWRYE